ncbi:hypothetical protein Peur_015367 [Populus x canadensis]
MNCQLGKSTRKPAAPEEEIQQPNNNCDQIQIYHGTVSSSQLDPFGMLFASKSPKLCFQRSQTYQNCTKLNPAVHL